MEVLKGEGVNWYSALLPSGAFLMFKSDVDSAAKIAAGDTAKVHHLLRITPGQGNPYYVPAVIGSGDEVLLNGRQFMVVATVKEDMAAEFDGLIEQLFKGPSNIQPAPANANLEAEARRAKLK